MAHFTAFKEFESDTRRRFRPLHGTRSYYDDIKATLEALADLPSDAAAPAVSSSGRRTDLVDVCWISSRRHVLYLMHIDSVPTLADDVDNVISRFAAYVASTRVSYSYGAPVPAGGKREIMSLEWRSLTGLVESAKSKKVPDVLTR